MPSLLQKLGWATLRSLSSNKTTHLSSRLHPWKRIFKNDFWIKKVISEGFDPALISVDFDERNTYAILVLAGHAHTYDDPERRHGDLLRASLRSQDYSIENLEVKFSDFILNIVNVMEPQSAMIDIPDFNRICDDKAKDPRVTIIYYHMKDVSFIKPNQCVLEIATYSLRIMQNYGFSFYAI